MHLLQGPAATAWALLETPATSRSLILALARAYGTSAASIGAEVEEMLGALVDAGTLQKETPLA